MPMLNEAEEPQTESGEEGGGPVKSFLEHLEDLRWTLIKCTVAILVGAIVCLVAGNRIVEVLKRPLEQADFSKPVPAETVGIFWGTNQLGAFRLGTNELAGLGLTNQMPAILRIEPTLVGTNYVLALQAHSDDAGQVQAQSRINLLNLSPIEGFYVAIQIAIFGGLAIALPFVLYYLAQFILPALKRVERRLVFRGIGIGSILFLGGVLFCYFVVLPIALNAAAKYSIWLGFEADQWRARDYISFVSKFMFGMGIGFELPVLVLTLVSIGVVSYETLARIRPYMLMILMALSAVLTPPDIISQIFMSVPLYLLYELSVWIAWYWDRQEKKRTAGKN